MIVRMLSTKIPSFLVLIGYVSGESRKNCPKAAIPAARSNCANKLPCSQGTLLQRTVIMLSFHKTLLFHGQTSEETASMKLKVEPK
jgi:hypothetical protein